MEGKEHSMLGDLRAMLARPALPALAVLGLLAAGCSQLDDQSMGFWDLLWGMVFFFFWFMALWIFISCFMDIIRRNDMTGVSKVIWILVLFWLPLLGCLIYLIMRPKVTAQDVQLMAQAEAASKAAAGVTTADQLEKLAQLKEAGAITVPEYEALKKKAIEG
jgi:hypothetical protein